MVDHPMVPRRLPFVFCALLVACAHTGGAKAPETIEGVWGGTHVVEGQVPETVQLFQRSDRWFVRTGDHEQPLEPYDNGMRAVLAPWTAEVRFAGLDADAPLQAGHWIQSSSPVRSSRYASPLRAKRDEEGWTARVRPLRDEARLYLAIEAPVQGKARAFVREPGSNYGRHLRELEVIRRGARLQFVSRGEPAFEGHLEDDGKMAIDLPYLGGRWTLDRLDPTELEGFLARSSTTARYRYEAPKAMDDGWATASLSDVGMNAEPIAALMQEIIAAVPDSWTSPDIHAVLVARRGKLVVEEYFHGQDRDTPHDSRSSGKSIASTLLAMAPGTKDIHQPLHTVVPDLPDAWRTHPSKSSVTIGHLLSMSSGLACDDNDEKSPGQEDRMQEASEDWYGYTLALDSENEPGTKGAYCSAGINLAGLALASSTKRWIPEFFDKELARPLQISTYYFNLMPDGQGYLAGGLRLRSRDFAKLGQVFLDDGTWNGARILDAEWVEEATSAHAGLNEADDYGYGWWRIRYAVGDKRYDAFYASGNGGQLLVVVPSLELVVQLNAGNYGNYGTWRKFRDEWVPKHIIAAVEDR